MCLSSFFHFMLSRMNTTNLHTATAPVGIFDSGYGGLTILEQVRKGLPQYDYLYLGDNARAPYGTRSFEIVYEFTKQAVFRLFEEGCSLVILACNTASAKALRSIQQNDLPRLAPDKRVLGVIRPTVEALSEFSHTGHIGILATPGTIQSQSYELEIKKMYPRFEVYGQACPMWVPLVENNEAQGPGADYFVKKYIDELLAQSPDIDTVVLGCTHYPLLLDKIRACLPPSVSVVVQGPLVTDRLSDYLHRHREIEYRCSKGGNCRYLTTESPQKFSEAAALFLKEPVVAEHIVLG